MWICSFGSLEPVVLTHFRLALFAAMNPGACRLIETPATNAIGDLLREVAKALGIEVGPQNSGRELRERIDYVLRFSTLLLCFDEAQLILPVAYSRNTAPARLNWVRRSVDRSEHRGRVHLHTAELPSG